jgi:dTMP kinase
MEKRKVLLAFDLGTSGVKCSVFDTKAKHLVSAYGEYATYFPKEGFQEHKPAEWVEAIRRSLTEMKEILSNGGTVLLDRYVYSNIAYQCAKVKNEAEAENLRNWIFNTEYGNFELPKPDLNIFLDVPIAFVEQKLKSSRGGQDREYLEGAQDIHEADIEFQKRVRSIYRRQCELDPDFIRIDCSDEYGMMMSPGEIFAKVKAVVDERL